MKIEIIEKRLEIAYLWQQNKISYGEAIKRLMALEFTREDAIAYLRS
jgi:hypothetical protein